MGRPRLIGSLKYWLRSPGWKPPPGTVSLPPMKQPGGGTLASLPPLATRPPPSGVLETSGHRAAAPPGLPQCPTQGPRATAAHLFSHHLRRARPQPPPWPIPVGACPTRIDRGSWHPPADLPLWQPQERTLLTRSPHSQNFMVLATSGPHALHRWPLAVLPVQPAGGALSPTKGWPESLSLSPQAARSSTGPFGKALEGNQPRPTEPAERAQEGALVAVPWHVC